MISNKDFGYTVRYKQIGSNKWKVYLVTNTYDGALWNVRWYERDPPKDRISGKPIENVIWNIFPIKTLIEYKWRWRGCPFSP